MYSSYFFVLVFITCMLFVPRASSTENQYLFIEWTPCLNITITITSYMPLNVSITCIYGSLRIIVDELHGKSKDTLRQKCSQYLD